MDRSTPTALARRLSGVFCLLLSLALPQLASAQPAVAACSTGDALVATATGRPETLAISGSEIVIDGGARSNADVRVSGSNNTLNGAISYATRFEDSGDANSYPAPARVPAAPTSLQYDLNSYRPGGAAAEAALAAGRYRVVNGTLDVPEDTRLDGLYYVTGDAKLAASNIRGTFTIVAEGLIDASGSNLQAQPYTGGLLLLSNRAEPGSAVLKLGGSGAELRGVLAAPGGMVELSGGGNLIVGAVTGHTLKVSGSELRVRFAPEYCPGAPIPPAETYVADEVVVKLFDANDLGAVALANGLDPNPRGQFGTRPIYRLRIQGNADPRLVVDRLQLDSRVEFAEPNYMTQTPEGRRGRSSWVVGETQNGYAEQWAPAALRLDDAHDVTLGNGVTVAVLDTGVDASHPKLADRLVPGFDFVDFDSDPSEVGSQASNVGFGHGTHVAGLVARAAPGAKIMPVRVLDPEGVGNIWVLSEGLLFAAERGPDGVARSGDEAHVINLSLGTLRQTKLLEAIVREVSCAGDDDDDNASCAAAHGVVVIAAAGNDGDSVPQYPAAEAVEGLLAVAATTPADTLAGFSSFGDWVPIAAPGDLIVSTVPGGGYGTWSGTSMAAPLAAGVAALVRSVEPDLPASQVTERLVETGRTICGPITSRLDAAAALGAPASPPADCSLPHSTFISALFHS